MRWHLRCCPHLGVSDARLNIAIILAATILVAIMSPPVWPAEAQIMWSESEMSCATASEQLGVPIIQDLDPSEIALLD